MPLRRLSHLLLAAVAILTVAPAAAFARVTVSPLDGTPDASPQTQISILGAAPSAIGAVAVRGSASGSHTGKLQAYSSGDGASYVLDKPLAEGEKVAVSVTASGHRATSHFTVARIGAVNPPPVPKTRPVFDFAVLDAFKSAPNLLAPKVTILKNSAAVANDGDLLITPAPAPPIAPNQPPNPHAVAKVLGPGGPMIADGQGNLVWFHLIPQTPGSAPFVATDLKELRFNGQAALGWWQGQINPLGFGQNGQEMIVGRDYGTLATVKSGNGYSIDLHDFILGSHGDAFATVYAPVVVNLRHYHGSSRTVMLDSIFQQIDLKTGLVKYEWHAWGHIGIGDSYNKPVALGYDPWHINSMQLLAHNRLLISNRNTFAGYEIDLATGRVIWTLGGKRSTFKMGRGAQFAFQHDIQLHGSTLTVYDDGAGPPVVHGTSRGLQLQISFKHHTASVAHQYIRSRSTLVGSQGNMQTLPNGNRLVGFGAAPFISEFSLSGSSLFDAALPTGDDTYRAYRVPWIGTPDPKASPPALAAAPGAGPSYTLYASWNGATEVASWQVVGGPSPSALPLKVGAPVARTGFETTIPIQTNQPYVAVQALNAAGQLLGTSPAIAP